jgi:hypothetical protein
MFVKLWKNIQIRIIYIFLFIIISFTALRYDAINTWLVRSSFTCAECSKPFTQLKEYLQHRRDLHETGRVKWAPVVGINLKKLDEIQSRCVLVLFWFEIF